MKKYIPIRGRNRCPICDTNDGRCREIIDGDRECISCMGFPDAKIGTVINGYKCVKSDSGKHIHPGSFWVRDNSAEWSQEQKEKWEEERRERQQQQQREEEDRRRRSLSAVLRHQKYELLLQQLDRHPDDRNDLLQRGFTDEEIERIGFKSIRRYQRLSINLDPQLPGVSKCGSYLLNAHDGYLCPIRNHEGLIIGLQYRLRQLPEGDTNRYRFLSSGSGEDVAVLKMPNGENPIGFYMPSSGKPDGIALVDSLGPKAFLASERLNKIIIGSAGGQFTASPQLFSLYLAKAQELVGSSLVTIYPDAGDVINGLVCRKLQLTADLVEDFGYAIEFAWWGQVTKEHCDIDELPVEQFGEIQYLSPTEFFDLVQGKEAWEGKVSSGNSRSIQNRHGLKKNSYKAGNKLSTTASMVLRTSPNLKIANTSERQSTESEAIDSQQIGREKFTQVLNPVLRSSQEIEFNQNGEFNGDREISREEWETQFKKPKNEESKPKSDDELQKLRLARAWEQWRKSRQFTGDTVINVPFLSRENVEDPKPDIITAIKSGLGTNKTGRIYDFINDSPLEGYVNLGYRNNLLIQFSEETKFYHYQQDLKGQAELELLLKDPNSKVCACVDSIIHFAAEDIENKTLIIDEAESVAQQLLTGDTAIAKWRGKAQKLFAEALKRAKRVVILDGNLTDKTANYLSDLCGKKTVKILNTYKANCSNKIFFHEGSVGVNGKISSSDRSAFLQYILKQCVQEGPFAIGSDNQIFIEAIDNIFKEMGLQGYRIDSSTCNESWVKEFLNGKDGPKNFITKYQPDYFLYSPSAESGVNIDIKGYFKHLYFAFAGVVLVNQQTQIIKRIRDPEAKIHVFCPPVGISENEISKSPFPHEIEYALRQYVVDCGQASLEGVDSAEALKKLIEKLVAESSDAHFKRECELKAIENFERSHLRECLREVLVEAGYEVVDMAEIKDVDSLKVVREAESKVKDLVATLTYNAPDISTQEAENLVSSKGGKLTRDEKCRVNKRRLLDRLPQIQEAKVDEEPVFSPEFVREVLFKDKHLIGKMEILYFLNNPESAKRLQQDKWFWALAGATIDEDPKSLRLSGYRSRYLKVKTLLDLGIQKFWNPGAEWSNESEDVISFHKACQNARTARNAGIRPGKDTPAAFIGKVLRNFGFSTDSSGKSNRIYQVTASPLDDPTKAAIYQSVARRIEAKIAELEQPDWSKISNQISVEVRPSNPSVATVSAVAPAAGILYKKPVAGATGIMKAKENVDEHKCSINPDGNEDISKLDKDTQGVLPSTALPRPSQSRTDATEVILQATQVDGFAKALRLKAGNTAIAVIAQATPKSLWSVVGDFDPFADERVLKVLARLNFGASPGYPSAC